MKDKDILIAVRERLGISELKPLQIEMFKTDLSRIILIAPTGSGKTLAFILFLLKHLSAPGKGVQALIIVPSRELAIQVGEITRKVAVGYKTSVFYGGHKMEEEEKSLSGNPDIIIATPGRFLDHINRNELSTTTISTLILDEYDKSLELGFEKDMREICSNISQKYTILTSATFLEGNLPDWLGKKPFNIFDFEEQNKGTVEKIHIESPARDKAETLTDLIFSLSPEQKTIIFVNHRESADRLYQFFKKRHVDAGLYHGALDQLDREKALFLFENGTTPVLVSTDLAGRGLDIDGIESVIHYHLPPTEENWIHRNGRTARNGKNGKIFIITSEGDNIPDYVTWDRDWYPKPKNYNEHFHSDRSTLHINAGRKEKISKGDIVGFLINNGNLSADEIGKIKIRDHDAMVSVPRDSAKAVVNNVNAFKLKNKKVKTTLVNV